MRRVAFALIAIMSMIAASGAARASVVVTIDKSQQMMSVAVDGAPRYTWPISTARAGYITPNGTYRPQFLARSWFSRRYYNSPMPYSIFFHGGYAIHGSYEISHLGGPASHGCVRLHPENAATLFALVQREGASHTRIVVTGASATHFVRARDPFQTRPFAEEVQQSPRWRYDAYDPYRDPYRPTPASSWWFGR
jgi:hypothetical protein